MKSLAKITLMRRKATHFLMTRRKLTAALVAIGLCLISLIVLFEGSAFSDGQFYDWKPMSHRPSKDKLKLRYFKTVTGQETFLYSAIANYREPEPGEVNIIITAFDSSGTDSLQCCVLLKNNKLYTTPANVYFKFYTEEVFAPLLELFKNAPTKAKQYSCVLPEIGYEAKHVMLTSSSCPSAVDDYLPIVYPKRIPNSLALCGKAAFGDRLDPNTLMEWFEVQRLLGVDHIQIMDLNNPQPVQKVFRYYTEMGLLNLLPYELPGRPYNRGLDQPHWVPQQASHDETFPILDCKQRLAGYTYVMGVDIDEILMPAQTHDLKTFIQEQLQLQPDAAGFFFWTQFFVYDWGPQNTETDIAVFRYLNSTEPRWECRKYIYLTNRVSQARTHDFQARSPYKQYYVPKDAAILHHYRVCPHVWSTCNPRRITDTSMLRFKDVLGERLKLAREATGINRL